MALKLSLAGRAQLWAEVVLPKGDRIFIATDEHFEVGAVVPLSLEIPELGSELIVSATVVGKRPATPSTPAGLVVSLTSSMVGRVEGALNAKSTIAAGEAAKAPAPMPKVERQFAARVVIPHVIEGCAVKALATSSMTLSTPSGQSASGLKAEEVIVVALQLPDGEAHMPATVTWLRPELSLVGLRVGTLDPHVLSRIKRALEAEAADAVMPSGYTIVVADDDPSILDFMTRILSAQGHRVVGAERGDVALQLVRHERPKLVFLDVLMPGLDGLEVCAAIRNDPALAKTPVVLLSAMGEQRLTEAVRTSKANDSLTKPMRIESVRAMLTKYL